MKRALSIFTKMAGSTVRKPKVQVLEAQDPGSKDQTFIFNGEDHTLGNSLRYMIMKNPEVDVCGYTIPHPSENKIHFRIQTRGSPAIDVLRQGLNDLFDLCEHVENTFKEALDSSTKRCV